MQTDLQSLATRIRRHPRAHGANIVALGQLLLTAKSLCEPGKFSQWFHELRAGFSLRTAQETMTAATRLANISNLHRLSPSTLQMLCSRKIKRRQEAIDRILELTEQRKIRWAEAREIISETDPTSIYGYPESDPRHVKEENTLEAIGRQLVAMLRDPSVLSVHFSPDHDTGCDTANDRGSSESIRLTILGEEEDGKPKRVTVTRRDLGMTLAAAVGEEKNRLCRGCNRELPPSQFSKSCRRCKRCERARVKRHDQKKRRRIDPEVN